MKRLVVAVVVAVSGLAACDPSLEINVTADKGAALTSSGDLGLSGRLWCSKPVPVDFFVRVTQGGVESSAGDETIDCTEDDPAPWSRVFDISGRLHTGRAVLNLQASTNESSDNDFYELERFIEIS